jgi:GrpB-like predicted nucleotidyltransferase (UPF0157 family)
MILIINGPCGVGKTEVSRNLVARFPEGVMLDGDHIGAVHPFEIHDRERIAYLYQTIRHLIAFHIEHGYSNFVVNYVFETPQSLAQLRGRLFELDAVTYAFRLTGAERELERRIRARATKQAAWELERFRELAAVMEAGAERGDLGYLIDTTGLTAAQVAEVIWKNIHQAVDLRPYDPAWPAEYAAEQTRLRAVLGALALKIHHIGSTAVPELDAKPIIDIMVEVRKLEDALTCIAPLRALGYAFIDHPENADRRFFRKGSPRTHHLHIVEQGNASVADHLAFRDALRAGRELRQRYAQLKAELAARHRHDRNRYTVSKTAFVESVLRP